jgi:hypothetical protein
MGLLEKIGITHKELPMTAEKCCYETRHGAGSFKSREDRISDKQESITGAINLKTGAIMTGVNNQVGASYQCVIDIDQDLQDKDSVELIFQPFIEAGFEILNLSEAIKDIIPTKGLYLISWERAFQDVEKIVRL